MVSTNRTSAQKHTILKTQPFRVKLKPPQVSQPDLFNVVFHSFCVCIGFEGCLGGEDVWGFVWPNTPNEKRVEIACPDGQGI